MARGWMITGYTTRSPVSSARLKVSHRGMPLPGRRLGDVSPSAVNYLCVVGGWARRVRTGMATMDRMAAAMMKSGRYPRVSTRAAPIVMGKV